VQVEQAFLYRDGTMTNLGTLGGTRSTAHDINDHDQVVGSAYTTDNAFERAFLYENGTMRDLGTLGGNQSAAHAINNNGQIVGYSSLGDGTTHAFLYANGVMTDLLGSVGGRTIAWDINNKGQVVGQYQPEDVTYAFLFSDGVRTDLGFDLIAYGINDHGQVVGAQAPLGEGGHAFLYSDGAVIDLNDQIPPDSGWVLTEARAINNAGQIVGLGYLKGVAGARAFLLTPVCAPDGLQASGSIYRICMPPGGKYNGDLVIWAHGFQDAGTPVQIPEDQLVIGDFSIPDIVTRLGFGFATNSYSKTGLAVRQGMADILDLIEIYTAQHGAPKRVYLTGASEGGLITTLLIEQHPDKFTGGLAACGPIGDFPFQINYFGDARLLFEVYFPGLIPGDPFNPPQELVENWESYYWGVVSTVLFDPANQNKLLQWIRVAKLPYVTGDSFWYSVGVSVADVLRYAVVNARDAATTLGGFPYDNRDRIYTGSDNNFLLNLLVPRLRAEGTALTEMKTHYNTRGQLAVPLVTLHTTRDQQVPQPHQAFYTLKTLFTGDLLTLHVPLTVDRFEHCNFEAAEVLVSFGLLLQATGAPLPTSDIAAVVPQESQAQFKALAEEHGLK
jgi:probable HAF family extracellular repeat protein